MPLQRNQQKSSQKVKERPFSGAIMWNNKNISFPKAVWMWDCAAEVTSREEVPNFLFPAHCAQAVSQSPLSHLPHGECVSSGDLMHSQKEPDAYATQSFMFHLINGRIFKPAISLPALSSSSYTPKALSQNLCAEPNRRHRRSPNIQKHGFKTLASPAQPKTLILKKYLIPCSLMRVNLPTRAHAALL